MRRFLASFAFLVLLPVCAQAEVVERIVAIVNDEVITLSDMKSFEDRLRTGRLLDNLLVPDEATKQALLKNRDQLLEKMIEEKVIDSEVKKQKLSVPIEQVEQEIRAVARQNNVSRDEFKAALRSHGIEFSKYQDFMKTGLERKSLIEKSVTSRIKISEDDVMTAYTAKHGAKDDQAYEYTISHIFFQSSKSGGASAAKSRAEGALKKLREGMNFEKLASEISEDPAFEQDGLLGVFKTGELQKSLEAHLKGLNQGDFTGVVPISGGYHIVKLNKKRLIPDPRTEKEREKIRAQLYENAYKRQFKSWLEQLRKDAFVRINK